MDPLASNPKNIRRVEIIMGVGGLAGHVIESANDFRDPGHDPGHILKILLIFPIFYAKIILHCIYS